MDPQLTLLLTELMEVVQETAPAVWGITLRQVYVEAIQHLVKTIVFGGIGFYLYRSAKYLRKKHEEQPHEMFDFLGGMVFLLAGLCGVGSVLDFVFALSRVINPRFYAIQLLADMAGK